MRRKSESVRHGNIVSDALQYVDQSEEADVILPHLSSISEPYRDTYHRYFDAIFTAKLGLGYLTGVFELLLGTLIYVMCLPFVRKTGHFQVRMVSDQ